MGCRFILVGPTGTPRVEEQSFGIFNAAVYDDMNDNFLGCVDISKSLTEQTLDMTFRAARFMAGILMAFGALSTFLCLCLQCFIKSGKSWLWSVMRTSYMGALAAQGAVYAVFFSNMCSNFQGQPSQCWAGRDGVIGVFNFILLFGMVIATCYSFPPRHPVFQCWGEGMDDDYSADEDISTKVGDIPRMTPEEGAVNDEELGGNDNMSVSLFSGNKSVLSIKSFLSKKSKAPEDADDKQPPADNKSIKNADTDEDKSADGSEPEVAQESEKTSTVVEPAAVVPAVAEKDTVSVSSNTSKKSDKGSLAGRIWGRKSLPSAGSSLSGVPQKVDETEEDSKGGTVQKSTTVDAVATMSSIVSDDEDTESIQFLRSLAAVSRLSKGGLRVKTVERDHQIEMTDEYPAKAGEGLNAPHSSDGADIIRVRTEYYDGGSRTTKEVTHHDGSRTVTTIIDSQSGKNDTMPISRKTSGKESIANETEDGTEMSLNRAIVVETVESKDSKSGSQAASRTSAASRNSRMSVRKSAVPVSSLRQKFSGPPANR